MGRYSGDISVAGPGQCFPWANLQNVRILIHRKRNLYMYIKYFLHKGLFFYEVLAQYAYSI